MNTQPEAWNIKVVYNNIIVEIPEPRAQYEAALVRMKVGEFIYMGGRKMKLVNKDVVSALDISKRSYRVNFTSAGNISAEVTSPDSDVAKFKTNKKSPQEEPVIVTKMKDGSIMASWGSWENFASAYLSIGDIITYSVYPDQRNKIIGVEYERFSETGFNISQITVLVN